MNALGQISSLKTCPPAQAVRRFLAAMRKAADVTFDPWRNVLLEAFEECPLTYDTRRAVYEMQPYADLYFAGVVGMEAAKIRALFDPQDATELLAEIAEHVDAAANRSDRLVSAIVFDIISQIQLIRPEQHKLPHDQVVRTILERIGLPAFPETRPLFDDLLLRHRLAEPLARGVPSWWMAFRMKFILMRNGAVPVAARVMPRPRTARSLI